VSGHAEAVGDRLEILLLLVDAVLGAPPPGLMDKGSVSGVHEADDTVIDADGHFGLKVSELVFCAELFNAWRGLAGFGWLGESGTGWSGIGDIDPDEIVLFFAGVAAGVNAIDLHRLIGGKGRDQLALSVVNIELPAVIGAFEILAIETSGVERHAAVGAGVAKRERPVSAVAADDEGEFQQRCSVELIALDTVGGQGTIPEAGKHQSVGGLALRKVEFGHGGFENVD